MKPHAHFFPRIPLQVLGGNALSLSVRRLIATTNFMSGFGESHLQTPFGKLRKEQQSKLASPMTGEGAAEISPQAAFSLPAPLSGSAVRMSLERADSPPQRHRAGQRPASNFSRARAAQPEIWKEKGRANRSDRGGVQFPADYRQREQSLGLSRYRLQADRDGGVAAKREPRKRMTETSSDTSVGSFSLLVHLPPKVDYARVPIRFPLQEYPFSMQATEIHNL